MLRWWSTPTQTSSPRVADTSCLTSAAAYNKKRKTYESGKCSPQVWNARCCHTMSIISVYKHDGNCKTPASSVPVSHTQDVFPFEVEWVGCLVKEQNLTFICQEMGIGISLKQTWFLPQETKLKYYICQFIRLQLYIEKSNESRLTQLDYSSCKRMKQSIDWYACWTWSAIPPPPLFFPHPPKTKKQNNRQQ